MTDLDPTADATATATALPPVVRVATVARTPEDAFDVFTEEIGAWWPLPTHGMFGDRAGGVRFVGDRLVEVAVDGTEATWGEVLAWEPPSRLVLAWHPGSPDGPAGRVEVTFEPDPVGTRVQIRHDGWEAFGEEAASRRRTYGGPSAWGHVLDHFAGVAETGSDPAIDELRDAYEAFFAEAEAGGFGSPPAGEWDAATVVAHVALTDLSMAAVAQSLVHRGEPRFENDVCQEPANLARVVGEQGAANGDLTSLIAFGRACARLAVAAAARLDDEQRAHPVPCLLRSDGEVMLDDARPWEQIAVMIQTGMHLPAHTAQLRDLRAT